MRSLPENKTPCGFFYGSPYDELKKAKAAGDLERTAFLEAGLLECGRQGCGITWRDHFGVAKREDPAAKRLKITPTRK